jgi:hypothetical protein
MQVISITLLGSDLEAQRLHAALLKAGLNKKIEKAGGGHVSLLLTSRQVSSKKMEKARRRAEALHKAAVAAHKARTKRMMERNKRWEGK